MACAPCWLLALLIVASAWGDVEARHSDSTPAATRLVPKLHGIWNCPADRNHFTSIENYTIVLAKDGSDFLSMACTLRKKMKTISKLSIIFHRCQPGTVSDRNCEYYETFNWVASACSFLVAKGVVWAQFIESIRPTFQCPIDKGHYVVTNGTVNMLKIDVLARGANVEKFAWRTEVRMYNELREMVVCAFFVSEMRRVAVKRGPRAP